MGTKGDFDKTACIKRMTAAIKPVGDYGSDELVSDREIDGSVELTVTPDLEVECTRAELEAACIEAVRLGLRSVDLWDEALTIMLTETPRLDYVRSTEDQVSRETRFEFAVAGGGASLWSGTAHVDFMGFVEGADEDDADEDEWSISASMVYVVHASALGAGGPTGASSGGGRP